MFLRRPAKLWSTSKVHPQLQDRGDPANQNERQPLTDVSKGTGLGIAEHSHRSAIATKILDEAKADLASYLDVPEDYEILFMQGGGTGQFSSVVYNLVGAWVTRKQQEAEKAGADEAKVEADLKKQVDERELQLDFIVTGGWSLKAYQEACRLLGPEHVNLVADARKINPDKKFGKIPEESTWNLSKSPAMVYYCDNETVDGRSKSNGIYLYANSYS